MTTYVDKSNHVSGHLSWELLAEISDMTVEEYKAAHNEKYGRFSFDCRPFIEGIECPFGERDLMHDTCYIGNEEHRCKYFSRYVFDGKHYGCIECKHPPLPKKEKYVQLDLFDMI